MTTDESPNTSTPGHRLLAFADDWGRHPSSCQHLVKHLLPRYDTAWVDTIGMRTPKLNLSTISRGIEKLSHWMRPKTPASEVALPPGLTVLRPKMWPWFTHNWDRALNRRLLLSSLGRWIESQSTPVTAITTLPIVADLMGKLPVDHWVYYCVDDFSQWPGVDQQTMLAMEKTVIEKADVIIAVSRHLQQHIQKQGRESELLIHGVDLDFWQSTDSAPALPELQSWERPFVVFWGLVDRRMDLDFLRHLSAAMSQGTILLVGPDAEPDPALTQIPRVQRLPAQPFDALPALGRAASVLIMPYADLPVTHAMQPLKMLEYLATGRPVVVRNLPSTREWTDCLDAVATPEEFTAAVLKRLETGIPTDQTVARQRLQSESWASKARQMEQWIFGVPSSFG